MWDELFEVAKRKRSAVKAFKNLQTLWKGINWAATLKDCNEFFKQGVSCLHSYSGMDLICKLRHQCCTFSQNVPRSRLGSEAHSSDLAYSFPVVYLY